MHRPRPAEVKKKSAMSACSFAHSEMLPAVLKRPGRRPFRPFKVSEEVFDQTDRGRRQGLAELEAGGSLSVHQQHTPAVPGQGDGGCGSRRPGADDDHVPCGTGPVTQRHRRHDLASLGGRPVQRRIALLFGEYDLAVIFQVAAVLILDRQHHSQF